MNPDKMSDLHVENLTVDNLKVVSKDGKHSLVVSSFENGVGLWLQNDKTGVTMYSMDGQGAVVAAFNQHKQHSGHQFAFLVDNDGNPQLQLVINGQVKMVDLNKLP